MLVHKYALIKYVKVKNIFDIIFLLIIIIYASKTANMFSL